MNNSIRHTLITSLMLLAFSACSTVFEDGDEDCPLNPPVIPDKPEPDKPVDPSNPITSTDPSVNDWHVIDNLLASSETRGIGVDIPLVNNDAELKDLQIFVYDETGDTFLNSLQILSTEPLADGNTLVHGFLPKECSAIVFDQLRCKLLVLGNTKATDGTMESMQSLKFKANNEIIPLFGVANVIKRLDTKLEVLCGEIPLLSSGALVTVQLDKLLSDAGITLGSATIKNINQNGYILPKNVAKLNMAESYTAGELFNPEDSEKSDISLLTMNEGSTMRAFIPECAAPTAGATEIELQFLLNGEPYTGKFGNKLYFKDYATDKPFNIERGNHYIFTIRSLATDGELDIKVEEWKEVAPEDVIFK